MRAARSDTATSPRAGKRPGRGDQSDSNCVKASSSPLQYLARATGGTSVTRPAICFSNVLGPKLTLTGRQVCASLYLHLLTQRAKGDQPSEPCWAVGFHVQHRASRSIPARSSEFGRGAGIRAVLFSPCSDERTCVYQGGACHRAAVSAGCWARARLHTELALCASRRSLSRRSLICSLIHRHRLSNSWAAGPLSRHCQARGHKR